MSRPLDVSARRPVRQRIPGGTVNGFGGVRLHGKRIGKLALGVIALGAITVQGLGPALGATVQLNAPVLGGTPTTTTSSVALKWSDPNTRESGYVVERSAAAAGPFTQIKNLNHNKTSYTDTGRAAGTTYYYRVYARGKKKAVSPMSNVVSARTQGGTPVDNIAPGVPGGVNAHATGCNSITVGWSAVTDTGGSGLRGYFVWRNGARITPLNAPLSGTSYTDGTPAGSSTYSYKVSAIDNAGNESSQSANAASATTPACPDTIAPGVPQNVHATPNSCSSVSVTWSAVTDTGGSGLRGYYVWRDSTRLTPAGAPLTGTSYTDTAASPSSDPVYRVSAIDNAGNESAQGFGQAVTPACPDTTAPGIPGGVSANATSCGNVLVSWSAVTDTGGSGLRGYKLWRNGALIAGPMTSTSYQDDNNTAPSTAYSYKVSAVDNAGNESAQSGAANATTPACPDMTAPGIPTGVNADYLSCSTTIVQWNAVTDTGGSGLRGYYVWRNGTRITPANAPITGTRFDDSGLSQGVQYTYKVSAIDNAGNESNQSAASNTLTMYPCPDTVAPAVPGGVTASATSCNSVNVGWSATTDTGGSGLRGYYVWRNGTRVTPVNAPVTGTSIVDNTVAGNTTYTYKVSAVDNANNESSQSPAGASSTTPACPDTIAPGVPGGVTASSTSCSTVNVGWNAVSDTGGSGLRGYYVWRNGTRITPVNAPLTGTSFTDTGLAQTTAYSYKVSAIDNANPGNESAQSTAAASATTQTCPTQPPGAYVSAKRFGGTGIDNGYAIGSGSDGSYAITGEFTGSVSFGGTPLTSVGQTDIPVAKFAANGTPMWSKRLGGAIYDRGQAIVIAPDGDVIVAGTFQGTADFGNGLVTVPANSTHAFIARYDSQTGAPVWSRTFVGNQSGDYAYGLAMAPNGDVVVTGSYQGTLDFGSVVLSSNRSSSDVFVARYTPTGVNVWARSYGNSANDAGKGVAVDSNDSVIVVGEFMGGVDFAGGNSDACIGSNQPPSCVRSVDASTDGFIVKYNPNGTTAWVKSFGSTFGDNAFAVGVDAANNVIATGVWQLQVDFGAGLVWSNGSADIWIQKWTPAGTRIWAKTMGGAGYDAAYGLAVDSTGGFAITGNFQKPTSAPSNIDFGGGARPGFGGYDGFVAKYNANGQYRWDKVWGDPFDSDWGLDVAIGAQDHVLAIGGFAGTANFGGGNITSAGGRDIIVAELAS